MPSHRPWRPHSGWPLHVSRPPVCRSAAVGALAALATCGALAACGGASDGPPTRPVGAGAARIALSVTLPAADTTREGRYEAWVVDAAGARHSLGRFVAGGSSLLDSPVADPVAVEVTLEPPGDADAVPSPRMLLRGTLRSGRAELGYAGAVTQSGLALREAPGQFTMFTPSDNDSLGYPSREESGVWLFNMSPNATAQKDYYVRLAQLASGWTYEGWMVRDIGQPNAIWLSYGKFVPDWTGAVNQPDDTGWGPFSGVLDYRRARLEDFPGDDWVSNPLGLPWRAELPLPLDLREKDAQGRGRWTHVITIEPASDRGEPITTERPFFMRPYVDAFGDAGPGIARTITAHFESMPRGAAEVR